MNEQNGRIQQLSIRQQIQQQNLKYLNQISGLAKIESNKIIKNKIPLMGSNVSENTNTIKIKEEVNKCVTVVVGSYKDKS